MNILIVHPAFPGQFFYLAPYLAQNPENRVVFLAQNNTIGAQLQGVELAVDPTERKKPKGTHRYLRPAEDAVREGQEVVRSLHSLKQKGFVPDVIMGHTGWGSLLYTKDFYPDVPVLGYFEWYYHGLHSDGCWWPDEKISIDDCTRLRTKNAHHLLSLEACDAGYTPTQWQYDQFPQEYRYKLTIQHDGVDTVFCQPAPEPVGLELPDVGLSLPVGTEIVTYVSRGFEIYRGFPYFMAAIREVLAHRPQCHVVIVGADKVCYGDPLKGTTYQKEEEKKGGYDTQRVHFVGPRNRGDYRRILQASSAHVYLTRPFVLSWSMLEAMSFGLPLVASKTPPVEEVVEDGVNGLLAEFRSPHHIARRLEELLSDRALAARLGKAARETILTRYELTKCLQRQEDMLYRLVK